MLKYWNLLGIPVFLVCTSIPGLAETSHGDQEGIHESQQQEKRKGMGSSIESQNPSSKSEESEQKGARPGGVGEEGETSMFGSPNTLPPGEESPQYEGADKEQQERERQQ